MSQGKKANSAQYLWQVRLGPFRLTRSDIRMDDHDRVGTAHLYMQRLLLEVGKRRRSIRLHVIHRADVDHCLHDHPWAFWALVLWGGYVEEVPTPDATPAEAVAGFPRRVDNVVRPFRLHYRPLDYKHRISRLLRRVSITLAYAGPLDQHWGFHTTEGKVPWEEFVTEGRARRVLWCDIRTP